MLLDGTYNKKNAKPKTRQEFQTTKNTMKKKKQKYVSWNTSRDTVSTDSN